MTFSEKNIYNQVCVRVCVCVFFSLSRLFSSPSFSLSLLVVTQIRRHIAGSSPPLPTVGALHLYRENILALSSLVDSRLSCTNI